MTNEHFEEFARRTMSSRRFPDWLKDDAPPPTSWLGEPAEWVAIRERAKAAWSLRPILEFADAIVRGWRPHELASGQLDGRASIGILDRSVRRDEPLTDPGLRQRATAALERARRINAPIDPITRVNLEAMVAGSWGARGGGAQVAAVEAATREAEAREAAAKAQEKTRPKIAVPVAFRALGRTFGAGTYKVEASTLEALQSWQEKMQAQARARGWERPEHRGPWPAFAVVQEPTEAQRV